MLLTLAAIVAAALSLSAHHSFSAYYFEEQSVTIEGVVQEFQYRSPHAVLMFTARDDQGQTRTYAAEWGNPNRLSRQGITRDTLKPGDAVVVTGSPGRTATEYKLHLKGIRRPADGWSWRNRG
jgi:hypothetical protein